jgi:hypothetical protein
MNMRPTVTKKCGLSVTVAAAQKDKSYESYSHHFQPHQRLCAN